MSLALTRRRFVRGSVIGLAALAGTGLTIEGLIREPEHPVAQNVTIRLSRLPEAFHGFRIAQLSDIHFGPYMDQERLERSVRLAQAFQPELVVLTGDFVSHPLHQHDGPEGARNAEPCADVFARWNGVPFLAVLGNHDHWNNADMVAGALAERGIRVLRNQA